MQPFHDNHCLRVLGSSVPIGGLELIPIHLYVDGNRPTVATVLHDEIDPSLLIARWPNLTPNFYRGG